MVIYREWKDVLQEYSLAERCMAYEAIMDYAFDGVVSDDPLIRGITALMRQRIDKDQLKYQEISNKRAEAGRLGGLRRKANKQMKQMLSNEANATNCQQMKANVANHSKLKHDNDYDNDILSSNEDEYKRLSPTEILEKFISENQITLESICMDYGISIDDFRVTAEKILRLWQLDKWDCRPIEKGNGEFSARHLINEVRYKLKSNKQNQTQDDRFSKRRGTDATAWSESEFSDTL